MYEAVRTLARGQSEGTHRYHCPGCLAERRNKHDKPFSVTREDDRLIFLCFHCGYKGACDIVEKPQAHLITIPRPTGLSPAQNYLASRGITRRVFDDAGILFQESVFFPSLGKAMRAVGFPYKRDGATYAVKWRGIDQKAFTQTGAAQSLFMIEHIKPGEPVVVCEGECFPPETEILTTNGWQRLGDYTTGDVAQVEIDGSIAFATPTARIEKHHEENLVKHWVRGWTSVTTAEHDLISINHKGLWYKHKAATRPNSGIDLIPRVGRLDGAGINLTDDQIALSIAVSADAAIRPVKNTGWRKAISDRYVVFAFKKQRKVDRLRRLLSTLGVAQVSDTTIKRGYTSICFPLPGWVPGRHLPWSWVADATMAQRDFILAEMVHWNGNSVPNRNQTEYSSKYYDNACWMQTMAHTSGRCSSVIKRSNPHGTWFKASVLYGKTTSSWQSVETNMIPYSGMVHCLTMPSGMLLVRHEGHISISGNCDALSFWQAGIPAVSVPNGAPQKVSASTPNGDDRKYQYLRQAETLLKSVPKFFLACDSDAPGEALGEELARRLGRGKCWKIRWPNECKDANAVLLNEGAASLRELVEKAEPWPVKGLYDAAHFIEAVDALYETGLVRGKSTGFAEVDSIYTVLPGQLTIVTGIPSMGKSAFVDQILTNLAQREGWRFAVCSFENEPRVHIAKLMQLYAKKPFFEGVTPRMIEQDKRHSFSWVRDHFSFLFQGDGHQSTIEDIIDRLRSAVLRYGIRGVVIDPYNFIDRPKDMNETDWVSDMLTKLKVFAMAHELHIWLVAHPTKQYRQDDGAYRVPGGYDISGSSHFFNKADVGMTIHRPDLYKSTAEVHIWKCRYNWVGKPGKATLFYEPATGCYFEPQKVWAPMPLRGKPN